MQLTAADEKANSVDLDQAALFAQTGLSIYSRTSLARTPLES